MRSDQLGVQVHCLRHRIAAEGLPATLDRVRALGLRSIELVRFPGCRGNPWGDFGAATDLAPTRIAASLAAAGLHCPSVMVGEAELSNGCLGRSLDWIDGVGCHRVVLTALHAAEPGSPRYMETVIEHASRCAREGFDFVLHTHPELWDSSDRPRPIERLMRPALLGAAQASAVQWYFLEMEVADRNETLSALERSLARLQALQPLLCAGDMT